MRRLLVLTAVLALVPAAPAAADFVQDNGSPLRVGFAPYGVAAADMDGNGTPDLAAASATSSLSLTLGEPEGNDIRIRAGSATRQVAGAATGKPGLPVART